MTIEKRKLTKRTYKVFIEGELINLCIPNEEAIELDGWADWFNNLGNLKNTRHGIFPNTTQNQKKILKEIQNQLKEIQNQQKLALLVCEKKNNQAFGIVSLQSIDFSNKSAEIAINIGNPGLSSMPSMASLEAMALISEHGFELLGLQRIYAGQAYPNLLGWNKLLEIIGFKAEGITRNSFKRGHDVSDTVLIACNYEDYLVLRDMRGSLWGDISLIKKALRNQPKQSFTQKINESLLEIEKEHFEYIYKN
jgi:RimJ/RimL family protein N-acetyltransferase